MDEVTLKRLLFSKRLFNHGIQHSNNNTELDRFLAIHHFDNAIELFLKIVATKEGITKSSKKDWIFKTLWEEINKKLKENAGYELPLQDQIFTLHDTRNLAQHQGDPPSFEIVIKYQGYIKDFLNKCFIDIFEINFDEIFASSLIEDPKIKEALIESEKYIGENDFEKSIESSAKAFLFLKQNENLYFSGELGSMRFRNNRMRLSQLFASDSPKILKEVANEIDTIFTERINEFSGAVKEEIGLLKLGINYKEFKIFNEISPIVNFSYVLNNVSLKNKEKKYHTKENALFCHEFVLEAALKLQGITAK